MMKTEIRRILLIAGCIALSAISLDNSLNAQTFYVDINRGNDSNPGTICNPVKTISEAAQRVRTLGNHNQVTIKIYPGIYNLDDKVLFDVQQKFEERARLIIEAIVLPDDDDWDPSQMPVIISTAKAQANFGFECSIGFDIEISHITIRGLKFLGNPVPEIYYYPIGRQGKRLDDLVVTQCLFIGDKDTLPIQSGILAHGNKVIINHCIFYNCRNSVVFYFVDEDREVKRTGSEMTYCIVDGGYESGIWTAAPDTNFKFHHNIVTRCQNFWVHNLLNNTKYSITDCFISDNIFSISKVTSSFEFSQSQNIYHEKNVSKEGKIQLVFKNDIDMPKNYLHPMPGTPGSNLGAGLFIKNY